MTELSNLQTPTPFTYTNYLTVYNCSPFTYTGTVQFLTTWFTAAINGTEYPASNSEVISFADAETNTIIYKTYVFPGVTVTSLTPGENIELVILHCMITEDLIKSFGRCFRQ